LLAGGKERVRTGRGNLTKRVNGKQHLCDARLFLELRVEMLVTSLQPKKEDDTQR